MTAGFSPSDLRIGASFAGKRGAAAATSLHKASRTIADMPANFTRYPNSDAQVFVATTARSVAGRELALDADTLRSFGSLAVPGHVWRAMLRLGTWIEPVLAAEWARLTRGYGERSALRPARSRRLSPGSSRSATSSWLARQRWRS